jgi:hypothetical protein
VKWPPAHAHPGAEGFPRVGEGQRAAEREGRWEAGWGAGEHG